MAPWDGHHVPSPWVSGLMLSFPWLAKRMRAGEGNPHGFQSGGGHQRKAPVLRNPCSLVKTEHTCDPLHPRPRLELCHQCMSSSAQKVEASISSMGIRDGCSAKDPRCPHTTPRWLVGAAGGSGSHCLCSGPGDVPPLLAKTVSAILQAPWSVPRHHEGR